jgi:hypothetical protein
MEQSSTPLKNMKRLCKKYPKETQVSNNPGLLTEFNRAYNILVEMVLQKDRYGYKALLGHIVSESTPPCNINYLNLKIKLDQDLERTINRIYKLLKLS